MIELSLLSYKKNLRIYRSFTKGWVFQLLEELKKEKSLKNKERLSCLELNIIFISKAKMKKLNKNYRGLDKVTDVLSFEGDGQFSLGELLICKDVVREKALNSVLTEKLYLQLLVSHGVLHLFGYEHEFDHKKEKEMFVLQNKLLKKIAQKLAPKYKNEFDIAL